jgi:hypothetical protein
VYLQNISTKNKRQEALKTICWPDLYKKYANILYMFLNLLKILTAIFIGISSLFVGTNINKDDPNKLIDIGNLKTSTTTNEAITDLVNNQKTNNSEVATAPKKDGPEIIIKSDPEIITKNTMSDLGENILDLIVTIPPQKTEESFGVTEINDLARGALVNIICTTKQGGLLQPITGSGMIIDERGVVLTNAHIGQYYLLKDLFVEDFLECFIRQGSPAINAYKAELLFISSSWIKENYKKIATSNPKGTGENDFALLIINESTNPSVPLPQKFPFVFPDLRNMEPEVGDSVIVAGYPAGFLGGQTIQKDLHAVSTVTQVKEVFTFTENSLDLFSVGGNIAAQKGSSGGGVVGFNKRLLGIVVTASDATQTDDRDLRAITLSHINKSIQKDTGSDLNNYLFGNLLQKSLQFREVVAPDLEKLLEGALVPSTQ